MKSSSAGGALLTASYQKDVAIPAFTFMYVKGGLSAQTKLNGIWEDDLGYTAATSSSISSGSLPPGVTLTDVDGTTNPNGSGTFPHLLLAGTPTTAGSYTFTIDISVLHTLAGYTPNDTITMSDTFTLIITNPANVDYGDGTGTDNNGDPISVSITSSSLSDITFGSLEEGTAMSGFLGPLITSTVSGGTITTSTVIDSIDTLPAGITVQVTPSGALYFSGTPTSANTYVVNVTLTTTLTIDGYTVSDQATDSAIITFIVASAPAIDDTGYLMSSGFDLSTVLAPLLSSQTGTNTPTGYITAGGIDINTVCSPLTNGGSAHTTGYQVNGVDLGSLFALKGSQ